MQHDRPHKVRHDFVFGLVNVFSCSYIYLNSFSWCFFIKETDVFERFHAVEMELFAHILCRIISNSKTIRIELFFHI